ncbi:uncharacterized protein B0T15DRAFT_531102 [Chaetomium strumarium]|uniref:Uncharacterized protein n=1 Tax=Chaetomium strumarium TaxID=1170767 RepID=A0AAJ0GRX9_9PEZI|nr:hypothetical protein B0T15DRAFT_531102 [Chaetomium strumarium]
MNSITLSTKDASHLTPRPSPKSPFKSCSRSHHRTPGYGQEQVAANKRATSNNNGTTQPFQPSPQPQPHSSGAARQWVVGSKVGKLNRSTARVGFWLDGVTYNNAECRGARPSVALAHRPRRVSQGRKPTTTTPSMASWHTKSRHVHDITTRISSCAQRIPLADITPPASFDTDDDGALVPPPDVTMVHTGTGNELPARYRTPSLPAAIDLLTDDEARRLLLRAAQANLSLAAAIRQVALTRADNAVCRTRAVEPIRQDSRESFLVDTFVEEEPLLNGG